MSEKPSNVVEALCAVMKELPAIGKDQRASQAQGGYEYRGIESIASHTQPLFAKYGIVFTPHVRFYDVREIVVNDKPWTDTYELVEYTVYGPGGTEDKITVGPILAVGRDNADKGGNKCLTQAFKYALIQALNIADAKDDSDTGSPEADRRTKKAAPTAAAKPEGKSLGKGAPPAAAPLADLRRDWYGAAQNATLTDDELLRHIQSKWKVAGSKDLDEDQLRADIGVFNALVAFGEEKITEFKQALPTRKAS